MRRPLCLLCLFYVIGVFLILKLFPALEQGKEQLRDGEECTLLGEVYGMEYKNDRSVLYLKTSKDGASHFKAVCYVENGQAPSGLRIGNRVYVRGALRLFEEASNDGQFNARLYYRIQGIQCFMTGCRVSLEDSAFRPYEQGLYEIRSYLSGIFRESLPEKYAGIMQAVFLGERNGLDKDIKELFQRNGISHILAISGLHISFLGMGIFRFFRKIKAPPLWGAALSAGFVVSFGVMTGQSASTVRSIVMFLLFLLAGLWGRTYDMLTAAALSGVILLSKQPLYLYHSGFLLSFGAVMGIALLAPSLEKIMLREDPGESMVINRSRGRKAVRFLKKKGKASLLSSLSISLATLPIQLSFFYSFPVYSVFLNLFIIPAMGLLMAAGAAGLFLSCLCPFAGGFFMTPCKWILMICEGLCRFFDSLPGGNPVLGRPKLWQSAVYYGLLLWIIFIKKPLHRKCRGAVVLAGIALLCIRVRGATACTMLDIGQGDCMVIEERSGYNILVDGGSSDVSEAGEYRIIPYLKSHGIHRLDYVFVSHGDSDHISGVLEILSKEGKGEIKVDCLVLTKFAVHDSAYGELLAYANRLGVKLLFVSEGDWFEIGNTRFECLYPGMDAEGEGNDQSMVLFMECGGVGTLFTGDLPGERERELLEKTKQKNIQILKVAHHGSKYSTTDEFIESCVPKTAIISAGKNNSYGHPHKETLKRLKENGCRVYGTFSHGAITIRYEKRKYTVLTYKKM